METPFTRQNLAEIEDSAPAAGMSETQEARFARKQLEARATGVSYQRLKPKRRSAFGHKHDAAEEVYVVLGGSGRMKLDDEIIAIAPLDAIRVAPGVTRAFEAGPDGLEFLAFGARHDGDGELIRDWWTD
jgi:uncharacterized cupin superfamily protein